MYVYSETTFESWCTPIYNKHRPKAKFSKGGVYDVARSENRPRPHEIDQRQIDPRSPMMYQLMLARGSRHGGGWDLH